MRRSFCAISTIPRMKTGKTPGNALIFYHFQQSLRKNLEKFKKGFRFVEKKDIINKSW